MLSELCVALLAIKWCCFVRSLVVIVLSQHDEPIQRNIGPIYQFPIQDAYRRRRHEYLRVPHGSTQLSNASASVIVRYSPEVMAERPKVILRAPAAQLIS